MPLPFTAANLSPPGTQQPRELEEGEALPAAVGAPPGTDLACARLPAQPHSALACGNPCSHEELLGPLSGHVRAVH